MKEFLHNDVCHTLILLRIILWYLLITIVIYFPALAAAQPEEIDSEGKQWGSYGGGSSYGGGYRPSRPSYGSYRPSRPSYGSSYGGYGRKKRDTESEGKYNHSISHFSFTLNIF